jgi:hypothetical protein
MPQSDTASPTAALYRLSDVKRRQRRVAPLTLLLLAAWVASIFVIIALVRPLMVTRSAWYGVLILLYLFASFAVFGYLWVRVFRWAGLRCPHCGSTFMYIDLKDSSRDADVRAEEQRRCSRCQSIIIDLEG